MSRIRARRVTSVAVFVCVLCAISIQARGFGFAGQDARRVGRITGVVWNADGTPVPDARVRLRNISSGRIDRAMVSTPEGQFTFDGVLPAAYLVELVDEAGRVRAVGQRFEVAAGETVATFIRLAAPRPWFAGFFSNAAVAALAAASTVGVTAIGSNAPPASPQ